MVTATGGSTRSSDILEAETGLGNTEADGKEIESAAETAARLIHDNQNALIEDCRREILARPPLQKVAAQHRIAESDDWLRQAISLYRMCMTSTGPATEWHDEVGELNFAAGLSIADAHAFLAILRDRLLQLGADAAERGELPYESIPDITRALLRAFDFSLAVQASAYMREGQRHLNEVNRNLTFRQRTFERDLALATLVQQRFIPKGFASRHFRAEVRYVPTIGVGGDHAGIFPVSPERLYVTICDVTGHGIASALAAEMVNSQLRPRLRRQIDTTFQYGIEPVMIVRELNELFCTQFQPLGMLLTFFIALIDAASRTITYSGAGHPPPILQSCSSHECIELRSQNVILGAAKDCVIGAGEDTLPIHPGDRVVFYTDGIIEANDGKGNMLGLDGLQTILQKHYRTPQSKLADEILGAAQQLTGDNESDDMSLILLNLLDQGDASGKEM